MVEVNITWFGWLQDSSSNSDKVWGWIEIDGNNYNFWARRGKKMQFKRHDAGTDTWLKIYAKERKGYREVRDAQIDQAWPDFMETVRKQLINAKMRNKVRNDGF